MLPSFKRFTSYIFFPFLFQHIKLFFLCGKSFPTCLVGNNILRLDEKSTYKLVGDLKLKKIHQMVENDVKNSFRSVPKMSNIFRDLHKNIEHFQRLVKKCRTFSEIYIKKWVDATLPSRITTCGNIATTILFINTDI